jgi:hypothetical protein
MTQQPERDESGYYSIGEKSLPSVTTILDDQLEKPGLEAWKRKHDDWKQRRDRAALVGTLAHRKCLNPLALRDLPIEEVDPSVVDDDLSVDVEVCHALWEDIKHELPITDTPHVEKTLWKSEPGFAGTADLITGGCVVDLKTSKSVDRRSYALQIASYAKAAEARGVAEIDRAAICKLDYRNTTAGIRWLNSDQLNTLYDQFCKLVEGFHAQQRLG